MSDFFHVVHVLIAIGLVGLVLIQHGKGADAGAAFGSGASSTVFGSQGSGNFLSRTTAVLATGFFLTSLILAYFSSQVTEPESVVGEEVVKEAPAPTAPSDLPVLPTEQNTQTNTEMPSLPAEATTAPAATDELPVVAPATEAASPADDAASTDKPAAQ